MNFIIPQNFNFKNKFLGLIDYPTLILDFIYLIFLNSLLNIFIHDLLVKLIFIIILFFPIFLLSLFSFNNESFIYVLFYIIKYYFSPRLYILNDVEK